MTEEVVGVKETLSQIQEEKQKLFIKEQQIIEKGLVSSNIDDIYSSQKYLQSIQKKDENSKVKSVLVDPFTLQSSFGYRDKNYSTVNFQTLRLMSKVHIINSIIKTRISQILSFCQPQPDKYSTGFIIKKKSQNRFGVENTTNTKSDEKIINYITDFIMNCGRESNVFCHDDISSFTTKFFQDSLSLDQGVFEVVRDKAGNLVEYFAVDGTTFRLADKSSMNEDREVNGYYPNVVQLLDGRVVQEFYPWEICFGVRNPNTSIYKQGYGESELEILIRTITSILNSDHYNANFFKVGSNPRGMFRYSGNINQNTLHDFRQHWQSTMSGVDNMHKVPFINADKIDWISTHETNKDMEFGKYYDFLIKVACAVYTIDPGEIGFPMNGSSDSKPMFEGNNEGRLKYSKDKGLRPLLKWYEKILNKYIVSQIHPEYELEFVGINEITEENELDRDIKELANFCTINEIREKRGMKPIPGGDIIANSFFLQSQQMQMYGGQDSNQVMDDENGKPQNDIENPFEQEDQTDIQKSSTDPFTKSLQDYLDSLN